MVKRLFDCVVAGAAMVALSPLLTMAAVGIRLSSRGPILYRATRMGYQGRMFTMLKFRTMNMDQGQSKSAITATHDRRIFLFGRLLRRLKIDELPQLINVMRGEMSLIGPRPEAPDIAAQHYGELERETLEVLPGLASPGSIYNYTHGAIYLDVPDPETAYVRDLMPIKLALDVVYVRRAGLLYDLRLIGRTLAVIAALSLGKRTYRNPPEFEEARRLRW